MQEKQGKRRYKRREIENQNQLLLKSTRKQIGDLEVVKIISKLLYTAVCSSSSKSSRHPQHHKLEGWRLIFQPPKDPPLPPPPRLMAAEISLLSNPNSCMRVSMVALEFIVVSPSICSCRGMVVSHSMEKWLFVRSNF